MLFKKVFLYFFIALTLLAAGNLAMPSSVLAAGKLDNTTPDINAPTTVTLTEEQKNAWQGFFRLPALSVVRRQPPQLPLLLNTFLGRTKLSKKTVRPTYSTYYYNPEAIYRWLATTLAPTLETPAKEPHLEIVNNRAVSFVPPQIGRRINKYQSTLNIIQALEQGRDTADLAIESANPQTSLKDLNDSGINELISRGQSSFKGSPNNRRHNIAVGVSKMQGVIVKPGEEFSFNKYLGPVEKSEGFLPELVIKAEGTIPELGGGLCQVSSTTFRSAMKAGLPITARRNHSYAVQYYAPQGTDATIYPGSADLKFINDTPGSILIWPYFPDKDTLIFDFYGTADNREVILQDPIVFDRKADGSMKASWTRIVTKNGISESKTFNSVYLPPALFHKQETFVANPGSPATTTPTSPSTGTITPTPAPEPAPTTPPLPDSL
jgi:vancomycin resistance protein YoaR